MTALAPVDEMVIVRVRGMPPRIALMVKRQDATAVVRLRMGLKWPRGIRWAPFLRTVLVTDIVRPATRREAVLGYAQAVAIPAGV